MIFAVSNEGIQLFLDSGLNSVHLTVRNLVPEMTISSLGSLLPAWNLLLSKIQDFLVNHLAQIPITPNQKETFEVREEVLASAGPQDMDISGYELSDLKDDDFFW